MSFGPNCDGRSTALACRFGLLSDPAFASTYEGSAQSIYDETKPKKNFSARAIDGTENGAGGSQLAAYYSDNRIIDGPNGEFYVVIIS